jgi:hypothetical protein
VPRGLWHSRSGAEFRLRPSDGAPIGVGPSGGARDPDSAPALPLGVEVATRRIELHAPGGVRRPLGRTTSGSAPAALIYPGPRSPHGCAVELDEIGGPRLLSSSGELWADISARKGATGPPSHGALHESAELLVFLPKSPLIVRDLRQSRVPSGMSYIAEQVTNRDCAAMICRPLRNHSAKAPCPGKRSGSHGPPDGGS